VDGGATNLRRSLTIAPQLENGGPVDSALATAVNLFRLGLRDSFELPLAAQVGFKFGKDT
jgi:hypothetical protein